MNQHDISYYWENDTKIAFCRVCSAEGADLICDCPGEFVDKQIDKDKKKD